MAIFSLWTVLSRRQKDTFTWKYIAAQWDVTGNV